MKKRNITQLAQLKIIESTIKAWLESGVHPSIIATALNNAFCHREAILNGGFELDDDDVILGEIFDGIEKFNEACKKVGG